MSLITTQSFVERTAHSYTGSAYILPCDDEERNRLQKQHRVYTRLLAGRLIFPPLSFSEKDEVLDIGAGGCAWLCDARTHLPESVQLYGIDIEPRLFPSRAALSTNINLSVCSGTQLPSYWSSKFTLVHQRLLIAAYTKEQWRLNIDEIYRVLKPGGWAQLIETGPEWIAGPKTLSHVAFLHRFSESKGMLFRCGICIPDMLKAAGFVDVTSEVVNISLGEWAGEDGIQGRDVMIGALRGMRDSVVKDDKSGRFPTGRAFNEAMDEIAEEWDNIKGTHSTVKVFYARKPLSSQAMGALVDYMQMFSSSIVVGSFRQFLPSNMFSLG